MNSSSVNKCFQDPAPHWCQNTQVIGCLKREHLLTSFFVTNNQNIESVLRGKATEMSAPYFEAKQPECQHCTQRQSNRNKSQKAGEATGYSCHINRATVTIKQNGSECQHDHFHRNQSHSFSAFTNQNANQAKYCLQEPLYQVVVPVGFLYQILSHTVQS